MPECKFPVPEDEIRGAARAIVHANRLRPRIQEIYARIGGDNFYGMGPAKELERIVEKMAGDGRTADQISDYLRARFIGSADELQDIAARLGRELGARQGDIIADPGRARLMTVDVDTATLGGSLSVETQFFTPPEAAIQGFVHAAYDITRATDGTFTDATYRAAVALRNRWLGRRGEAANFTKEQATEILRAAEGAGHAPDLDLSAAERLFDDAVAAGGAPAERLAGSEGLLPSSDDALRAELEAEAAARRSQPQRTLEGGVERPLTTEGPLEQQGALFDRGGPAQDVPVEQAGLPGIERPQPRKVNLFDEATGEPVPIAGGEPLSGRLGKNRTTPKVAERLGVDAPENDLQPGQLERIIDGIVGQFDRARSADPDIVTPPYAAGHGRVPPGPDDTHAWFARAMDAPPGQTATRLWRMWEGAQRRGAVKAEAFGIRAYEEAAQRAFPLERMKVQGDDQPAAVIDFMERVWERSAVDTFPVEQRPLAQMLYDELDGTERLILSVDPGFERSLINDYFPHMFKSDTRGRKVGERAGTVGRLKLGSKPGWRKNRRLTGPLGELLDTYPDLDLFSWDPIDFVVRHRLSANQYVENVQAMQKLKTLGLVMKKSEAEKLGGEYLNWRSPDAPAFRSKPVAAKPKGAVETTGQMSFEPGRPPSEASVIYTEPLVVPPQAADVIDDWYGTSIMDTTGYLNVMKKTVLTAKVIKVFGGLFQQADYTQRLLFGQGLGFQAPSSVPAAFRMWRRSFDIPYHKKLIAAEAQDGTVRAELDKFAIQAGSDPSFVEGSLRSAVGEELLPIPGIKQILTFLGGEAYGRFHREALYSAGEIMHKHFMLKGLSFSEAAEKAAARVNEFYSSPARWQSVMRNPSTRDWARIFAFAPGEVEGWARITWRGISSEDGARNLGGIMFGAFLTAEAINVMVTGHGLKASQLLPFRFDIDDRSELPFLDYNTNFLRPELPWTGPFGRKLYLDLLGQADTPFRLALAPLFGIKSRLGQLPGFATRVVAPLINEQPVTTFGGRPVDFNKPLDIVRLIGEQIAPIPLTPFSGGEAERIGFIGGAVQGAGLNISGESLGSRGTLARKFDELHPELAPFNPEAHFEIARADPELIPIIDELRRLGIQFGGEASIAASERDKILVQEEESLVQFSQGVLEGNLQAGPAWRERRSELLTFAAGTAAQAFGGINFDDPTTPEGQALERFYAITPDNFIDTETFELDHAAFDQARDKELSQLPEEVQEAIRLKMRFDDPDNIAVEKIRQEASPLLDLLYDDDRYGSFLGISQEREDEYREFMAKVRNQMDRIEEETAQRPSVTTMIQAVGQVDDKSEAFIQFAIAARPGSTTREQLRNPAREVFLLRNMEALRPLYPKLYETGRLRKAIARLAGTALPDPAPAGSSGGGRFGGDGGGGGGRFGGGDSEGGGGGRFR